MFSFITCQGPGFSPLFFWELWVPAYVSSVILEILTSVFLRAGFPPFIFLSAEGTHFIFWSVGCVLFYLNDCSVSELLSSQWLLFSFFILLRFGCLTFSFQQSWVLSLLFYWGLGMCFSPWWGLWFPAFLLYEVLWAPHCFFQKLEVLPLYSCGLRVFMLFSQGWSVFFVYLKAGHFLFSPTEDWVCLFLLFQGVLFPTFCPPEWVGSTPFVFRRAGCSPFLSSLVPEVQTL